MSLDDDGPYPDFDMFPTNRDLARDSSLAKVIDGLEKIQTLPDDQLKEALKKLVLKAPDSIRKRLSNFQQRNINSIRFGFDGLIRSLAYDGAEQVRTDAAINVMNKLRQVAPALMSFSTGP
jgi:hypothetical protein